MMCDEKEMFPFFYAWKNNPKRVTLYKKRCRVLAVGKKNSCMIEFANGQREIVSRHAVKRFPCNKEVKK